MPSLVIDRYGDYLVVQALSQGVDRLLPQITELLNELLSPAGILARNDPRVRLLEGLEQQVAVLSGDVPPAIDVREGRVQYVVDPLPRPENRFVPRPARKPRGGGALRTRPPARHVQLQRRIRAGAGAAVRNGDGDRHLRGRCRADQVQR